MAKPKTEQGSEHVENHAAPRVEVFGKVVQIEGFGTYHSN